MKCNKCGAELTSDTKFCSYCGNKIEETEIPPIPEEEIKETPQKEVFEENVEYEEKEFNDDYVPVKEEKTFGDKAKGKALEIWDNLDIYGKIATVGFALFGLFGIIAFFAGRIFAGVISAVQIAILVVALLMKKGIIKTPKKGISLLAFILSLVLIIPYFSLFSISTADFAKYDWNEIVLSDLMPEPASAYGVIDYNSENSFSLDVKKVSPKDFLNYVEECKEKGFSIDSEKTESSYTAFNKDGYKLTIDYDSTEKIMSISVDSPMDLGNLVWSDSEMAKLIPVPKSTIGKINTDSEDGFSVYVGKTSIEDYKAYVEECEKMGFTVESDKDEKHFYAKNSESFALTVNYEGNNVIYISVDEPDFYVDIEVECVENLMFSKYDVDVYIDDWEEGTVKHGATETFSTVVSRGSHTFKFVSAEDEDVTGEVKYDIYQDEELKVKISCSSSGISINTIKAPSPKKTTTTAEYILDYKDANSFETALNNGEKVNGKVVQFFVNDYVPDSALGINCWSGEHLNFISKNEINAKKGDTIIGKVIAEPSKVLGSWEIHYDVLAINGAKVENVPTETEEPKETEKPTETPKEPEKPSPVFYSTNDYDTAKKGNTGVFSYKEDGKLYDIYWIIDFDAGYVYYFTEGNGESTCDRLKIESGTLNDRIVITYHDGGDTWSYKLHFKYEGHPETLIMVDNNGFDYKYTTTDLDDALQLRSTKKIKDY